MFEINAFDEKKQEGTWVEYGGGEFLISWAHNPKFQKAYKRITKPYKKQIDKDTLDGELSTKLLCEAFAETILLDWKNVSSDGVEIKYSREAAMGALINNPEFRDFVAGFSAELENFKKEEVEEVSKK